MQNLYCSFARKAITKVHVQCTGKHKSGPGAIKPRGCKTFQQSLIFKVLINTEIAKIYISGLHHQSL